MKRLFSTAAFLLAASLSTAGVYPDFGYTPPSDWTQPTFVLSQNYPANKPAKPAFPWEQIDFTTNPAGYMQAVIAYCYEGNIPANFQPAKNAVRHWFHAPWLHYGPRGREFVNGLTTERSSRPYELSAAQTQSYRNFAVGFYNDLGGYMIGRVWANSSQPNFSSVSFPEGTVTFKLLFTTAPTSIAPWLAGSPEWVADIDRSPTAAQVLANKVRLLQIDIAVKDHRSKDGGWVFGTFHYDATVAGASPWQKLRPLTLMWGNDPTLTQTQYNQGTRPQESWINSASPIAQYRAHPPAGINAPRLFGWAGRGNGPVDNPISSCLSCHSTAQIQARSGMTIPNGATDAQALRWFRNLAPNTPFDAGQKTLDFSLQLGVGIQNFQAAHGAPSPVAPVTTKSGAMPHAAPAAAPAEPGTTLHLFSRDPEEDPAR